MPLPCCPPFWIMHLPWVFLVSHESCNFGLKVYEKL